MVNKGGNMKNKLGLLFLSLMFITVGCIGKNQKLTIHDKLIKNGYEMLEENEYKKELNEDEYYYINISTEIKYFIHYFNDDFQAYFFEQDWANVKLCEYNFKTSEAMNNADCSEEEIKEATNLKKLFNNEIDTMKITIPELIVFSYYND